MTTQPRKDTKLAVTIYSKGRFTSLMIGNVRAANLNHYQA